jgi:hypothetical protein
MIGWRMGVTGGWGEKESFFCRALKIHDKFGSLNDFFRRHLSSQHQASRISRDLASDLKHKLHIVFISTPPSASHLKRLCHNLLRGKPKFYAA